MAGEQSAAPIPEAWIGERVSIISLQHKTEGELIEVNDRGIVVSRPHTARRRREPGGVVEDVQTSEERFYPWDLVRSIIRLVDEQ